MDQTRAFEIATNYINFLVQEKKTPILRAFLFGSYSKGNYHEDSDIDLALVIPNVDDIIDLQIQLMVLRRDFSLDIEPHPICASDFSLANPFAYEVMQTGIEFIYDSSAHCFHSGFVNAGAA